MTLVPMIDTRRTIAAVAACYARHTPLEWGRWRAASLAEGLINHLDFEATVRTHFGQRMTLSVNDFVQRSIYCRGAWDEAIAEVIINRLRARHVFVDAGANVGFFTLLASTLVGPQGRVVAFEPHPVARAALANNVNLNKMTNVTISGFALSDSPTVMDLYFENEGGLGSSSLRQPPVEYRNGKVQVNVDTLDHQLAHLGIERVDMIKIDIEGAELAALRGAAETLRGHPAVICEISGYNLERMGGSEEGLMTLMRSHGYTCSAITPPRRSKFGPFQQYDALFEHRQ